MTITRAQVPYTDADDTQAIVGLGIATESTADITTAFAAADVAAIAAHKAVVAASGTHGLAKVAFPAGVNETTTDITITSMTVASVITAVLVQDDTSGVLTLRAAGDFVPGAGKAVSTANKADNSAGKHYLIFWTLP